MTELQTISVTPDIAARIIAEQIGLSPYLTELAFPLIEPSLTNPRKHFDPAKLQELADSIKASGIHQPLLVRPLPGSRVADTAWEPNSLRPRAIKPTHEIVAGERRYRAAKLAGLASVPVLVRHLTDAEALEAQVLENLNREDLTELEEAEGYEQLMQANGLTSDQVAAKVGKSRSYVYGRLKLLDLYPGGREALRLGQIDASVALLVARIPDTGVQAQALKALMDYGNISARTAADLIRRSYMLSLDSAPFDIKAESLTSAGACTTCPKRTGANPDLFAEVKGADLCTDPACHSAKVQAHRTATMAKAHERGLTVIEGREAKAIMPNSWQNHLDGYLRLDHKADSPTDQPLRKVLAKAMKHTGTQEVLLANPHKEGDLVAVLPTATVSELLTVAAQLDAKAAPAAQAMAEKTEAQRKSERAAVAAKRVTEFEAAWRWAVLVEVWAEAKSVAESHGLHNDGDLTGMPAFDQLARHVATRMAKSLNTDRAKRLCKVLGLDKVAPLDTLLAHVAIHPHPTALLWLLVAEADVEHRSWLGQDEHEANPGLMLAAQAFEVNIKAVQKSVKDELRDKHNAEDQQALLPPASAAQASGGRGGKVSETKPGENPGKRKSPRSAKSPAAPAATLSAEEASRGIAAAMQELGEEAAEPDGSAEAQRAAPDGMDAAPLQHQDAAQPGPTEPVAPTGETPAIVATPFAAGDVVLVDGAAEGVVVKRMKKGGQWTYLVKLDMGLQTLTSERVTAMVGVAA